MFPNEESYKFQPIGGNEGDGDGADAVDLYDDTAALLDATDDAGATGELTIGDADGLAGLAEEGGVVFEVVDLVGVRGDSTDEVLHLTVGNGEDAVLGIFGGDGIGPVAHGRESGLTLEVGDDDTGVVDEDQARDGGDKTALYIEVFAFVDDLHGKEVLDAFPPAWGTRGAGASSPEAVSIGRGHCHLGWQRTGGSRKCFYSSLVHCRSATYVNCLETGCKGTQ